MKPNLKKSFDKDRKLLFNKIKITNRNFNEMSGFFRITFKINKRVVFVSSKNIFATNRVFWAVFVRRFYFVRI